MDRDRIVSIQILRFVAAAAVVVCHVPPMLFLLTGRAQRWNDPLHVGFVGVDIFFVISGYVIALTGPFATPRPSGLKFFWGRWRRVAPIYFIATVPVVILPAIHGELDVSRLAASFLFWPGLRDGFVAPYLAVGWTLCFEMVFYTTVALLLAGGLTRRAMICAGAAVAALVAVRVATGWCAFLTSPLFLEFGGGVALCAARARLAAMRPWAGLAALGAALAGFALVCVIGTNAVEGYVVDPASNVRRVLLCGIPAALTVGGAIVLEPWVRSARWTKVLLIGGEASYSIYLTHEYCMDALTRLTWLLALPLWAMWIIGVVTPIAGGIFFWRFVESPVLRDLKRLGRRPDPDRVLQRTAA